MGRCFARRKDGGCGALNVQGCPGQYGCPFYKRVQEFKRDLNAANERLCSLPEDTQLEIAEKYHGGRMPWQGVCI
jgi:hypothetical protein